LNAELSKKTLVILVTFNGMKWLEGVLQPFEEAEGFDVWARDNGSSDGSYSFIQGHPAVVHCEKGENLGFGRANNLGMEFALNQGYGFVFLLNQDALILPDALAKLQAAGSVQSKHEVLCPVQLNWDGAGANFAFDRYYAPQWKSATGPFTVDFVNAAAWFMSTEVVQLVGGFNPLFFMYGEDRDWALRLNLLGGKFRVLPSVICRHDSSNQQKKKRPMSEILASKIYALEMAHCLFNAASHKDWARGFARRAIGRSLHRKQWFNTLLLRTLKAERHAFMRIDFERHDIESLRTSAKTPPAFLMKP